jgi:hypothetical protein
MSLIALKNVLILRRPRSGRLEGRTTPIQVIVDFLTAAFAGMSAPREGALSARCKSASELVVGSAIEGNCVAVKRGGEQPEVNRQSVG